MISKGRLKRFNIPRMLVFSIGLSVASCGIAPKKTSSQSNSLASEADQNPAVQLKSAAELQQSYYSLFGAGYDKLPPDLQDKSNKSKMTADANPTLFSFYADHLGLTSPLPMGQLHSDQLSGNVGYFLAATAIAQVSAERILEAKLTGSKAASLPGDCSDAINAKSILQKGLPNAFEKIQDSDIDQFRSDCARSLQAALVGLLTSAAFLQK